MDAEHLTIFVNQSWVLEVARWGWGGAEVIPTVDCCQNYVIGVASYVTGVLISRHRWTWAGNCDGWAVQHKLTSPSLCLGTPSGLWSQTAKPACTDDTVTDARVLCSLLLSLVPACTWLC